MTVGDQLGRTYSCYCGFKTSSREEMVKHSGGVHRQLIRKIRCPFCKEWGAVGSGGGVQWCIACGATYRLTEGAFMDGVFLDKWQDMRERIMKYIHEGRKGLELSEGAEMKAKELAKRLMSTTKWWTGKNPRTIAGGALYIASIIESQGRTQPDVAKVMNISTAGLRNNYRLFAEELELDVVVDTPKYIKKKEVHVYPHDPHRGRSVWSCGELEVVLRDGKWYRWSR